MQERAKTLPSVPAHCNWQQQKGVLKSLTRSYGKTERLYKALKNT